MLLNLTLAAVAAAVAGLVNALAGGGTLITFPALTALGVPPVVANVTNTVALCPGYLGGTLAQRGVLRARARRMAWMLPLSVLGGLLGGWLLLHSGERLFGALVPWLLLGATLLLLIQGRVRAWLQRRPQHHARWSALLVPSLTLAAIYGGYFGAGVSVIVMALLGLFLEDSFAALNGQKQLVSFGINVAAALLFLSSHKVDWSYAAVMAVSAPFGGWLGGRLAEKIPGALLRWFVIATGLAVSAVYFLRA